MKDKNSEKKGVIRRKLDIKDEIDKVNNCNGSLNEMVEKQNNKEVSSSVQIICKKLDIDRQKNLIETSKKESLHEKLIDNNKEKKKEW